jgi:hypothetical protein
VLASVDWLPAGFLATARQFAPYALGHPLEFAPLYGLLVGSVVSVLGLYLLLLLTSRFFLRKLQVVVSEHAQQRGGQRIVFRSRFQTLSRFRSKVLARRYPWAPNDEAPYVCLLHTQTRERFKACPPMFPSVIGRPGGCLGVTR